jgi:putative tryptophan/tyrosine transport system substrate-binding protein
VKRRDFITLLGGAAAVWPLVARAQRRVLPVVGLMGIGTAEAEASRFAAFREGLAAAEFVDTQNIAIEGRWAQNEPDKLAHFASEFVRRQVALIATVGTTAALAAQAVTTTTPVVFAIGGDPVSLGLVSNLARPGGNLTGVTFLANTLVAKRFEILLETIPVADVVGFLVRAKNPNTNSEAKEAHAAVHAKARRIVVADVGPSSDFEAAFDTLIRHGTKAICVQADQALMLPPNRLVRLADAHALPAVYSSRDAVAAGGLMSYGTSPNDAYRLLGSYAARILRGEKPGELPVQQSVKVELAVNLRTARTLGVEFPPTLLARADEVIE